ncbi:MAG: DMT family transporter [Nitrospinota bacterium]
MGWIYLLLAGVFEIGFATALKLSDGFTKLIPTIVFLILAVSGLFLLTRAIQSIPLGTAYAVWTGIGAVGTVIVGIFLFNESVTFSRMFFICVLIASIIGLKLV